MSNIHGSQQTQWATKWNMLERKKSTPQIYYSSTLSPNPLHQAEGRHTLLLGVLSCETFLCLWARLTPLPHTIKTVFLPNFSGGFVPAYQNFFAYAVFASKGRDVCHLQRKIPDLACKHGVIRKNGMAASTAIQHQHFCVQMTSAWSFTSCAVPARLGLTNQLGRKSPDLTVAMRSQKV